jgi:outer membrane protein TolC
VRTAVVLLALIGVAACSHLPPQPANVAASAQRLQALRLDDPAVSAALNQSDGAAGQPRWPPASYGLAELLRAAQQLNPALAESRAQLRAAMAAVSSAHAIPNPTLGLAFDRYLQEQAGSARSGWSAALDLPLSAISQRSLQTALADSRVRAARADYAARYWQLRAELRAGLRDWLLAERQSRLLQSSLADQQALAAAYRQRLREGAATPAELQQADLAALQTQRELSAAAARAGAARARLAQALGVSIAAVTGLNFAWPDLEQPAMPPVAQLTPLREQALLSREDVEHALADYDSRELELRLQLRAQYPQLTLGPGYTYDHGIRKLDFNLSLSLPVFNRNAGPIAEAEARRAAAGARLEGVQAQVLNEIDAALLALQSQLQALAQTRAQTALAAQQLEQTRTGVAAGADDRIALLNAEVVSFSSQLAELAAIDQAQQSLAALEDALRVPLPAAPAAAPGGNP